MAAAMPIKPSPGEWQSQGQDMFGEAVALPRLSHYLACLTEIGATGSSMGMSVVEWACSIF